MAFHRSEHTKTAAALLIILSLFLLGMQGQPPEDLERKRLVDQQTALSKRIASLNHEQEYLFMQKTFYASDSKYILLDLPSRTGMLKYRNRVLRTFTFTVTAGKRAVPPNTVLKVTTKADGKERRRVLLFGDTLLIQSKRSSTVSGNDKRIPRIVVGSKDFAALYYAVEQGTMLYTGK